MREKTQTIIDYFEIPDELALELDKLLVKQVIRERLLVQLIDEPEKYEQTEDSLIPITAKIEAIKLKITREYVPKKYQNRRYMWNYSGYEVNGNKMEVIEEL